MNGMVTKAPQQQQQHHECHLACSDNNDDAILASLSLLQHAECQITATHQDLPHQFPTEGRNFSSFSILFTGKVV
jgi:hypothetical protein